MEYFTAVHQAGIKVGSLGWLSGPDLNPGRLKFKKHAPEIREFTSKYIHAMHNAKFALGTWKRVVKTRPVALILNLFLQVCALFQVKIILKSI